MNQKPKAWYFLSANGHRNSLNTPTKNRMRKKFPVSRFSHIIWLKAMILDRKDKAMKMPNMLLRALKTSCNVSAKLSMSLFDEYVAPIFTYDSSLWGIPNALNLLYLDDQPEDRDTRVTVTDVLQTCSLRWRHNDHAGVSNHQPHGCLLNRLFSRKSKKTSKLRVTGLCAGNSPGTGEFPAQMASYAENVSIWWRHYAVAGAYRLQVPGEWGERDPDPPDANW